MAGEMSDDLRTALRELAGDIREYCRLPQSMALHRHEPDHIISVQHGGRTELENLALACMRCNRRKGPNIGSIDPVTGQLTPLFNPRTQLWPEHFRYEDGRLQPLSPEARVTEKVLQLNKPGRVAERQRQAAAGLLDLG